MRNRKQTTQWEKCASLAMAIFFAMADPLSTAATVIPESGASSSRVQSEIVLPIKDSAEDPQSVVENLPEELGLLQELSRDEKTSSQKNVPFVINLQDAHSNPQAQAKIQKILEHLKKKFPSLVIGVEGAVGQLHPEYFDFFPEYPETGEAVIKNLFEKGEITGSELFLWDEYKKQRESKTGKRTPVYGVETAELYRENLETFRELMSAREEISTELNALRAELYKRQSKIISPALRDFLKERSRRKDGKFGGDAQGQANLSVYLDFLIRAIREVLAIDLADPIEQLRFPNLIRIYYLKKTELQFDPAGASAQWLKVLELLRAQAKTEGEKAFIQTLEIYARKNRLLEGSGETPTASSGDFLYPRRLLEKVLAFAETRKIDLDGMDQFFSSFRLLVFRAEIEMPGLVKEMERLEEAVIEGLAATPEEKAFVRDIENTDLIEKMVYLELSRADFEKSIQRRAELSALMKKYLPAPSETDQVMVSLQKRLGSAYRFYATARLRDKAIVKNAMALMADRGAKMIKAEKKSKEKPVLVLITGGFHSEGILEELHKEGLPVAVISPRLTEIDAGKLYRDVMLDVNADVSLYVKDKSKVPFSSKQQALFFKEMIETAVPVLTKKYSITPDELPELLKQSFENHPVISKSFSVALEGEGRDANLRLSPKSEMARPGQLAQQTITDALLSGEDYGILRDAGLRPSPLNVAIGESGNVILGLPPSRQLRVGSMAVTQGRLTPELAGRGLKLIPPARNLQDLLAEVSAFDDGPAPDVLTSPLRRAAAEALDATGDFRNRLLDLASRTGGRSELRYAVEDRLGLIFTDTITDTSAGSERFLPAILGQSAGFEAASSVGLPAIQDTVRQALGAMSDFINPDSAPVHLVIPVEAESSLNPEENLGLILPLLVPAHKVTLLAYASKSVPDVTAMQLAFRNAMRQLGFPESAAARLTVESVQSRPSAVRQWMNANLRFDPKASVVLLENSMDRLRGSAYRKGLFRLFNGHVNTNVAPLLAASLIGKLGPEAQYEVQKLISLMTQSGIDPETAAQSISRVIEALRKIAQAA